MVRLSVVMCAAVVLMVGCQRGSQPVVPLTATTDVARIACGELLAASDVADADARVVVIGEVIEAVAAGSCPLLSGDRRLCRSLFLIGATDPLAGMGLGLDTTQIEQLIDWHRWALADGGDAAASDAALVAAFDAMRQADVGGALLSGDSGAIVDAAVARSTPSIIEPLAAAEQVCLSLPR